MNTDELRSLLMLTSIKGVGSIFVRQLLDAFGSAKAVLEADADVLSQLPRVGRCIIEGRDATDLQDRADRELQFIEAHNIETMLYGDDNYPTRLHDCPDAPALLFRLGNTPLNAQHTVSIVGTRSCTAYGKQCVDRFVSDLHEACPDVTIISGLALGIDGVAHKSSLAYGASTIGIVAHGLDRIYPSEHRQLARDILSNGGSIITEYLSGVQPERGNFLARNRIIAGLSDAVIVAESKDKGGSLVTASIALDYNREVFAFPGRAGDSRSEGCNRLIRLNRAGLITCAQDFIEAMNWGNSHTQQRSIQHSIPFEEEHLSRNARLIVDALRDRGDLRLPQLSEATGLDHSTLYEELLDLEVDGRIRTTPGGLYQLR